MYLEWLTGSLLKTKPANTPDTTTSSNTTGTLKVNALASRTDVVKLRFPYLEAAASASGAHPGASHAQQGICADAGRGPHARAKPTNQIQELRRMGTIRHGAG